MPSLSAQHRREHRDGQPKVFDIDPKASTDAKNLLQSSCYSIIRLWGTVRLMRTAREHGFARFSKAIQNSSTR